MKDRTFSIILFAVLGVCVLLTLAHFAYAIYAYQHCSIIEFIAKELW
jgi:hypothetical protein